jgi:alkanesulfonate monooxygenase SsuD/methylene tetrahydromethanopterin reductase-like flavin-dependent oxidoreductase (luciferase family)
MVMAGALSQLVRRAKIAVLGPTLPILNPVRVAEEFAMLDTMSGGRLVAGMMRGTPNEYVTYNINPAESRDRFAEALHLIRLAWTETRSFGWLGRYYHYRTISIWSRPVQQPHPPLYMSGSSPEAGEFAARNHIGIGFAFTTVPLAKSAVQHYRACARDAGWEPAAEDIIYRHVPCRRHGQRGFCRHEHAAAADQPRRPEPGHRGRRAAIGLLRRRCRGAAPAHLAA